MFVTMAPGRIVSAKRIEIAPGKSVAVGREGLSSRISCRGDGLVVSEALKKDKTAGYLLSAGEILVFSDLANVYNGGSEKAELSVIETDTI